MADDENNLVMHFHACEAVHLKKAVRLLASMASRAVIIYNPDCVTLSVTPDPTSSCDSDSDSDTIAAFLFATSTDFPYYWCSRFGLGGIRTSFLTSHLDLIKPGDTVNVQIAIPNDFCLIIVDPTGKVKLRDEMPLVECTNNNNDLNKIASVMPGQWRRIVALPCSEFAAMLKELGVFKKPVSIVVEQHKVSFYIENHEPRKTVFINKYGKRSFLPIEEHERIKMSLGHEHMSALMTAANLTERVLICLPSPPDPSPSSFTLMFEVVNSAKLVSFHVIVFRFTGKKERDGDGDGDNDS